MMVMRLAVWATVVGIGLGPTLADEASAAPKRQSMTAARRMAPRPHIAQRKHDGYEPLYSDGVGSSFGFRPGFGQGPHRLRAIYAARREGNALRETAAIDQLTRGYGYGSPFYAGYYGPGGGPMIGGLGHGY